MSKDKSYKVPVQKGPVSVEEQYSMSFRKQPESHNNDMKNLEMRRDKMRLTLHTPKR
jgi:hypothetical protein